MIQEEVTKNKWSPITPCRDGPSLSHLFFVDDLIFMGKATVSTTHTINRVLQRFFKASGLKLNPQKSKIFFSKQGGQLLKNIICEIMGFGQTHNLGKYQGVHLNHRRVNRATYSDLFDKILGRLSGWKSVYQCREDSISTGRDYCYPYTFYASNMATRKCM